MDPGSRMAEQFKRVKRVIYPDPEDSRIIAENETEDQENRFRRENYTSKPKKGFGLKRPNAKLPATPATNR